MDMVDYQGFRFQSHLNKEGYLETLLDISSPELSEPSLQPGARNRSIENLKEMLLELVNSMEQFSTKSNTLTEKTERLESELDKMKSSVETEIKQLLSHQKEIKPTAQQDAEQLRNDVAELEKKIEIKEAELNIRIEIKAAELEKRIKQEAVEQETRMIEATKSEILKSFLSFQKEEKDKDRMRVSGPVSLFKELTTRDLLNLQFTARSTIRDSYDYLESKNSELEKKLDALMNVVFKIVGNECLKLQKDTLLKNERSLHDENFMTESKEESSLDETENNLEELSPSLQSLSLSHPSSSV